MGPANPLHDQAVEAFGPGWAPAVTTVADDPDPRPLIAAAGVVVLGAATLVGVAVIAGRRAG